LPTTTFSDCRVSNQTNLFDDRVVCQSNSLPVNFAVAPLVDQFPDALQIRVPVCNIRLNPVEHVHGCFVNFEKDTIKDLQSKEMEE